MGLGMGEEGVVMVCMAEGVGMVCMAEEVVMVCMVEGAGVVRGRTAVSNRFAEDGEEGRVGNNDLVGGEKGGNYKRVGMCACDSGWGVGVEGINAAVGGMDHGGHMNCVDMEGEGDGEGEGVHIAGVEGGI